jgi:hypothetical protein
VLQTFTALAGTFLPLRARWSITMPELTLRMELFIQIAKNSTMQPLYQKSGHKFRLRLMAHRIRIPEK